MQMVSNVWNEIIIFACADLPVGLNEIRYVIIKTLRAVLYAL
jgi:hypothetical protein